MNTFTSTYERPVYLEEYDNFPLFSSLGLEVQINTIATAVVRNEQGTPATLLSHIVQIAELNDLTMRETYELLETRINGMKELWFERIRAACGI